MLPIFNNPIGFWLLLGVPAVIAIHFLQQRSRTLTITTMFLLQQLAPESQSGRTWDRIRNSRALWCQLLAVLLATWLLVEPRWLRSESSQTIVIVLDQSASMGAFRGAAQRALRGRIAASQGGAARSLWIVMSSDLRLAPFYRGANSEEALASFQAWQPTLGAHDASPALRLARSLARAEGLVWYITDTRENLVPDQPTVGVGRVISNIGFSGSSVFKEEGRLHWRAFIRNLGDTEQSRTWWVESGQARSEDKQVTLRPGAMAELRGAFPEGAERCSVKLSADAFTADDCLPLLRPRPKQLGVFVALDGAAGEFFSKLVPTIDGLSLTPRDKARLEVKRFDPLGQRPPGPAILLCPLARKADGERLSLAPRVPARHPLMEDLNWQSWLGLGAEELRMQPSDTSLLWQAQAPLICLGAGPEDGRTLIFNFNWEDSNASRLPATVLLVRRFLEAMRDAQAGSYAANFDCLAQVPLAGRELASPFDCSLEFQASRNGATRTQRSVTSAELGVLKAPEEAGFFVLRRGDTELVSGATQYADPRESDFRRAEAFFVDAKEQLGALVERNTRPDPHADLWMGLLGLCLLGSWWPGRRKS